MFRLKQGALLVAFLLASLACMTPPAAAQSWGGLYNMDGLLKQSHPFAAARPPAPGPARAPAVPSQPGPSRPAPTPTTASMADAGSSGGWFDDVFSEIRVGALLHDTGPFSSNEEDGIDANVELLFESPDIFSFMWSPRPHLGVSYNSGGDTSQLYTGLTWEWSFWDGWFAGFSLGGMVHDGHLVGEDGESKSLGCRFLFRESVNAGYRFNKRHALMVHFDHSSNANLCEKNTRDGSAEGRHDVTLNEGLESVGIRYGYMF